MKHETYKTIIKLVKSKKLKEPFFPVDITNAIPRAKNPETLRKFPSMHKKGNSRNLSMLLTQLKDGRYKLIRPFKYDLK